MVFVDGVAGTMEAFLLPTSNYNAKKYLGIS